MNSHRLEQSAGISDAHIKQCLQNWAFQVKITPQIRSRVLSLAANPTVAIQQSWHEWRPSLRWLLTIWIETPIFQNHQEYRNSPIMIHSLANEMFSLRLVS